VDVTVKTSLLLPAGACNRLRPEDLKAQDLLDQPQSLPEASLTAVLVDRVLGQAGVASQLRRCPAGAKGIGSKAALVGSNDRDWRPVGSTASLQKRLTEQGQTQSLACHDVGYACSLPGAGCIQKQAYACLLLHTAYQWHHKQVESFKERTWGGCLGSLVFL
jgi:hypothetical protein